MPEIHCHDREREHYPDGPIKDSGVEWSPSPHRGTDTCTWCGSVTPAFLVEKVRGRARWDYEKAYEQFQAEVDAGKVPHDRFIASMPRRPKAPEAPEVYIEYADWKYGWPHKLYFGSGYWKFYTKHLMDLSAEEFDATVEELHRLLPWVRWGRDEKGVHWRRWTPEEKAAWEAQQTPKEDAATSVAEPPPGPT